MELTDIMALVKAGYTKEEIALMEKPSTPAPAPDPEPAPTPEPAPVQVAEPVAHPHPYPNPHSRKHSRLWQNLCRVLQS